MQAKQKYKFKYKYKFNKNTNSNSNTNSNATKIQIQPQLLPLNKCDTRTSIELTNKHKFHKFPQILTTYFCKTFCPFLRADIL